MLNDKSESFLAHRLGFEEFYQESDERKLSWPLSMTRNTKRMIMEKHCQIDVSTHENGSSKLSVFLSIY